jgi:hypothetical protein
VITVAEVRAMRGLPPLPEGAGTNGDENEAQAQGTL